MISPLSRKTSQSSQAQVSITANLDDGTGSIYRTAHLHFQLQNCGANIPVTTGTTLIVQDAFDLRPATPGATITGTIIGNDQNSVWQRGVDVLSGHDSDPKQRRPLCPPQQRK